MIIARIVLVSAALMLTTTMFADAEVPCSGAALHEDTQFNLHKISPTWRGVTIPTGATGNVCNQFLLTFNPDGHTFTGAGAKVIGVTFGATCHPGDTGKGTAITGKVSVSCYVSEHKEVRRLLQLTLWETQPSPYAASYVAWESGTYGKGEPLFKGIGGDAPGAHDNFWLIVEPK
jgi:hypothetical protein